MIAQSIIADITEITINDTSKKYHSTQTLPLLEIDSALCQATISLYGGQILAFKSKDKPALLWLSSLTTFNRGDAIRGGIPLCAPWFGKHENRDYPNHGFARTSDWQLDSCAKLDSGEIRIDLSLKQSPHSSSFGYSAFTMTMSFILGKQLTIEFSLTNNSQSTIDCGWALHSYFNIDALATVEVSGLDGYQYLDATNGNQLGKLEGNQIFDSQVDRYFVNASSSQRINTGTPISLTGENCNTVITWNPGAELAAKMPDIGQDNYDKFVCVERGAAFDDSWQIPPSATKTAKLVISQ